MAIYAHNLSLITLEKHEAWDSAQTTTTLSNNNALEKNLDNRLSIAGKLEI